MQKETVELEYTFSLFMPLFSASDVAKACEIKVGCLRGWLQTKTIENVCVSYGVNKNGNGAGIARKFNLLNVFEIAVFSTLSKTGISISDCAYIAKLLRIDGFLQRDDREMLIVSINISGESINILRISNMGELHNLGDASIIYLMNISAIKSRVRNNIKQKVFSSTADDMGS